MYQLTYVSSATVPFSRDDLGLLLAGCRANNERAGLTGMLLFKGGNFMQTLEGPEAAVNETLNRIKNDKRHRGLLVLLRGPIASRAFDQWSMAFRDLDSLKTAGVAGYDPFLNTSLTDSRFKTDPTAAQKLLQVFKASM